MMTSGDMGLPAPVQGGEVDDDVMAAVAPEDPDKPKDTGEDFGFVRRIATRPSEAALAAIEAVYADTPTVLAAIEAVVADGTEVVYALGLPRQRSLDRRHPRGRRRGDGLRRRDPRARRQDRPGERRRRRRDP